MADRRTTSPTRGRLRAVPARHDNLVAAKLLAPPPRSGTIARERLYRPLDASARCPLTLVTAPAGSGKTTLLASWFARAPVPAAWLALDADDDDPARFWTYVMAAVRTRAPRVGEQTLALLRQPRPYRVAAALPTLLAELSELPHDLILIVDEMLPCAVIVSRGWSWRPALVSGVRWLGWSAAWA